MQSPPRTFPYQLNYTWLENIGESFESNRVELKKIYFSVINGKGIILNKSVFQETTYNKRDYEKDFLKMLKLAPRTKIIFRSNVYFVLDIWSKGPYHFYVDVLSKLIELKTTLKVDFGKSTIVLFRDNFTEKVIIPLLNQIGFSQLEIFLIEENKQYCFLGSNSFVTKPHIMGTNNPIVLSKVYDTLHNSFKGRLEGNFGSPRILYYYRLNRSRVVINDAEILGIFKKMGVYCTTFDDLSYLDAITLMSSIKVFIGIHGGGLTNMLFQKPGSKIIEIRNDNLNPNSHCYWHLARSLNFDYTVFIGETIGDSQIMEGNGCSVKVDVNQLISLIGEIDNES